MNAISLWQPWAHAVCRLGKRIENRASWHEGTPQLATARRLVGKPILIHAAKAGGTRQDFASALGFVVRIVGEAAFDAATPPGVPLPRMALVARATLADVAITLTSGHRTADHRLRNNGPPCLLCGADYSVGACPKADPWAQPGVGLVLADVVPLVAPVPYPGRQGWFDVPAEVCS